MRESGFWNYLKPKVIGRWQRIESPISSGFPDCMCLIDGVTLGVELKNKDCWCAGLGTSSIQRNWHKNWNEEGGLSFLLARINKDIILVGGWNLDNESGEKHWRSKAILEARVGDFDPVKLNQVMLEFRP